MATIREEFCCTGLRNLVACAGERGNAVVVWTDSRGEPRLLLQSRGVSYDDQSKLQPMDIDITINLSAEVGMRYCPTCGRLIEDLVAENPEFFQELAKEHVKYTPSQRLGDETQ